MRLELHDGWTDMLNARVLVGWEGGRFDPARGTFWALAFLPVEALRRALGASPDDPRLFHIVTALLHVATLIGAWRLVRWRFADARAAALIGFALAVPNLVFALYAPFRSSDLFPGLILLAMVLLAWRYGRKAERRAWLGLAAFGLLAALVKPNLGALCWLSAMAAATVTAPPERRWRQLGDLLAAALLGAGVFWIARAAVLAPSYDGFWLALPYQMMRALVGEMGKRAHIFDVRAFLYNLWAYGGAALLLFLLGAKTAWRGARSVDRAVLVGWVVFFALSLLGPTEVRYLAPLAPLTAWVATLGIARLPSRATAGLVALLAVIDVGLVVSTASGALSDVVGERGAFVELVGRLRQRQGPLLVEYGPVIALDYAPAWPYDRFHGLAHTSAPIIAGWTDRAMGDTAWSPARVKAVLASGEGTFLLASHTLIHGARTLTDEDFAAYRTSIAIPRSAPAALAIERTDAGARIVGEARFWSHHTLALADGTLVEAPMRRGGSLVLSAPLPPSLDDVRLLGAAPIAYCDVYGRCEP